MPPRVVCLILIVLFDCQLSNSVVYGAEETEGKFLRLFNGRDLEGWHGDERFWSVNDGAILGKTMIDNPSSENTFLVYKGESFDNFELRFSFKVQEFNSGVQYRSEVVKEWVVHGPQADFEAPWHEEKETGENIDEFSGMVYEEGGRGFLAQRGEAIIALHNSEDSQKPILDKIGSLGDPKDLAKLIEPGHWNQYKVVAIGSTAVHIINGRVMSLCIDLDEPNSRKSGIIAFQLHSGPPMSIRVKDVLIREFE